MRRSGKTTRKLRRVAVAAAVNAALLTAAPAFAHEGLGGRRAGWSDWNSDPVLLVNLTLFAWLYSRGVTRLWRRAGRGRVVNAWQTAAFGGGVATLLIALVSPIDALSEQLSWVHMIQHMLLMNVAAPLVVVAAPLYASAWGLSPRGQRWFGRLRRDAAKRRWWIYLLWQPLALSALYAVVLWIWHAPALYQAALRNPFVHDLQHLTFFFVACLFWRVLLDPISRFRAQPGVGVLCLFATSLHATVLGVLMALAPAPWYADYQARTSLWGWTALEDQQLAGLIMWMPACLAYAVAAVALFATWIQQHSNEPAAVMVKGPSP
jgi:putative membrane protein